MTNPAEISSKLIKEMIHDQGDLEMNESEVPKGLRSKLERAIAASIKDGITFDDNSIADLANGDYDEKHEKYDGFKSFDKLDQAIEDIAEKVLGL